MQIATWLGLHGAYAIAGGLIGWWVSKGLCALHWRWRGDSIRAKWRREFYERHPRLPAPDAVQRVLQWQAEQNAAMAGCPRSKADLN